MLITESQLESVLRQVISEVRGESRTQNAINFLEYIRRRLKKLYSNNQKQIDSTISSFIQLIEKYDLATAREMFAAKFEGDDKSVTTTDNTEEPKLNSDFFGGKEKADQLQRDFKAHQAQLARQKSSNKLDNPFSESKVCMENINYLIKNFFK